MNRYSPTTPSRLGGFAAVTAMSLMLAACGGPAGDDEAGPDDAASQGTSDSAAGREAQDPVVITHDGGMTVLDGDTLSATHEVVLQGFHRINPAGDDDHVVVSASDGFRILDAVHGRMTDIAFDGSKPGHVVRHGGRTVLFTDGTGQVRSFDPHDLDGGPPDTDTYQADEPHHGVAVALDDGTMLVTIGTEEERTGALAVDADGNEIARSEQCPGVHGEAAAEGGVVSFGCHDGVLLFKDGGFVKVPGDGGYTAISTQAGSESSPILLGNYMTDEKAEVERPDQFALIDGETATLEVVPMPQGVSYSSRSLGRGPGGEALILGTDGMLYVFDPASGEMKKSWPVVGEWTEPAEWQQPRPSLFVRGNDAYVTEPATRSVHRLDLDTGEVAADVRLDAVPNEISGSVHQH